MLLIRTSLKLSPIHGIGVFAEEFIPEGALIAEWIHGVDVRIPQETFYSLSQEQREVIRHYAYLEDEVYWLCSDNMRFFNHSYNPNTTSRSLSDFAARDIRRGEELTCDYYFFDEDAGHKLF